MLFLGVGLPCRPLSHPAAELAVVLLDTRGTVHAVEWRADLDEVAALARVLATGETLIAAGAPLCELSPDGRSHPAVRALRHRLALTDVESGVLECDADSFPSGADGFGADALGAADLEPDERLQTAWPPRVCGHGRRTSRRTARLAATCDDVVRRIGLLISAHPPVDLYSNELTAGLLVEPTPTTARGLEHRTVLLNALLCAWAASSWHGSPAQRSAAAGVPLAG